MIRARRPSTFWLLGLAFGAMLGAIALTGWAITDQARQVQQQTQDIMQDGVPSVVSAGHLQEILNACRIAERNYRTDPDPGQTATFNDDARRFQAVVSRELASPVFFPGERAQLLTLQASFARYVQDDGRFRRTGGTAPVEADLARLEREAREFEAINLRGMEQARKALMSLHDRQTRVVEVGIGLCLVGGMLCAFLFARSLARPLRRLTRAVAALPQRGPIPAIAFSRLAPSELVTLHATFQESAHLLEQADARRSEAEAELRDALARERLLTNDLDRQVHEKTRMLAKANAHLSQLVLELQDRDRQKAVFLAAISHELRTPLAILKGSLQTLQNPQLRLGPAEHDRLHQAMAEEIQHLAALVEDLLDTAQMDARSFALRLEADVDVASLVQGIVAGFGPQLETRGLSLELILREPLPAIQADPQRLGQVVRNLLDNVLKYAPAGSPVRLTVEAVPGGIEFVLEDGGPGVPESLRERIFEPFVRDPDPGRRGVGLGLAIARELVVAHGGTIELGASELGGSRFWFRLPTGGGPNRTASSPSR